MKTVKIFELNKFILITIDLGSNVNSLKINKISPISFISEICEVEFKGITIERFIKENNHTIGLIKLEIEGYGQIVLKVARETISKHKLVSLISIYYNKEKFFEIKDFLKRLNSNYNIIVRKLESKQAFIETKLIVRDENI